MKVLIGSDALREVVVNGVRFLHADYDERQMHREQEAAYNAEQQAEYDAWMNTQGPSGGAE
jgi:hypothetical protein